MKTPFEYFRDLALACYGVPEYRHTFDAAFQLMMQELCQTMGGKNHETKF